MFTKGDLKITTAVSAVLLAAGCGSKPNQSAGWTASGNTAVCTDEQGKRVDDRYCARNGYYGGHHYGWYYMGRGAFVPGMGGYARGGSYSAPAGTHFTRAGAASVSRGGFGSSAHAFSGRGG
jgi:hypothetical protein